MLLLHQLRARGSRLVLKRTHAEACRDGHSYRGGAQITGPPGAERTRKTCSMLYGGHGYVVQIQIQMQIQKEEGHHAVRAVRPW